MTKGERRAWLASRAPVALLSALVLGSTPFAVAAPGSSAVGAPRERASELGDAARANDGLTAAQRSAAELQRARAAFARREDPGKLSEAILRLTSASALAPEDPIPLDLLARAQAFRALSDPAAALDAWREASQAAERALRRASPSFAAAVDGGDDPGHAARLVDAAGAEPLYWLALATMGMAQARGMSAVLAVRAPARAMMQRAVELDERIDEGGPRRALGAWLATLPSAAGGGATAARAEFERARSLSPRYQLTRVRDAGVLAVLLQDRARFDALLGEVLAFDDRSAPELAPENRVAKRLARELLARRDRLF